MTYRDPDPRGNEAGAGVTGKPVALRPLCGCELTRRDPAASPPGWWDLSSFPRLQRQVLFPWIGWRAWSRDGEPGPGPVPRLCCCQIRLTQTERSRPQPSTCCSVCGLSVAERDGGASSWVAESEEPLQELCVNGNGHLETGGNPDPPCNCQKSPTCGVVVALRVVSSALIAAIIALAVLASKLSSADLCPPGTLVPRQLGRIPRETLLFLREGRELDRQPEPLLCTGCLPGWDRQ
ncbi:uncharacterized protein [Lepidochelys kempii]|uniref:uncharacterized protein n=1 Tax=Lepidochelys kempii TaxID=8472 RepID=UPI003C6F1F07